MQHTSRKSLGNSCLVSSGCSPSRGAVSLLTEGFIPATDVLLIGYEPSVSSGCSPSRGAVSLLTEGFIAVFQNVAPLGLGGLLVFNFLLTCRPAGALHSDL
jgi:hypothetical protein